MNHNTCPYCGSILEREQLYKKDKVLCEFCEIFVIPSVNGTRKERYRRMESVDYDHIRMNTAQIMEMHTYDLLLLLQLIRDQKRDYYNSVCTMKKVNSKIQNPEYKETEIEAGNQYEMMKRKNFVVENILRDRMGYIPKKVTQKLLLSFQERCRDGYNNKPMLIRKSD